MQLPDISSELSCQSSAAIPAQLSDISCCRHAFLVSEDDPRGGGGFIALCKSAPYTVQFGPFITNKGHSTYEFIRISQDVYLGFCA